MAGGEGDKMELVGYGEGATLTLTLTRALDPEVCNVVTQEWATVPAGAKLWRIDAADGTQEFFAVRGTTYASGHSYAAHFRYDPDTFGPATDVVWA